MNIHIIGDSHSAYSFENLADAQIYWFGPVTMHRFARDGFAVLEPVLSDFSKGDLLIVVVGEIDIRCHLVAIASKSNRSLEVVAEELAVNFVRQLSNFAKHHDVNAVLAQPMFPANRRPNPELPFIGTVRERLAAHRLLSNSLSRLCLENGISFLEIPNRYRGRDGLLNRKYSDDGVHIVPCEAAPLIKALQKILHLKLRFKSDSLLILKRRWRYYTWQKLRRTGIPESQPMDFFAVLKD